MKRKRIKAYILDSKKIKVVVKKAIVIWVILVCILLLLYAYYLKNKKTYIKYLENGNLQYKVYLNSNDFFKNQYIEKENEYITGLIDYIDTNFNYNLKMEKTDVTYSYLYRTEAVVNINKKDNSNLLYNYVEDITPKEQNETNDMELQIIKFEKIDYNKYNDIAKSFISLYNLKNDAKATLTINFYVNVIGNSENFESAVDNETIYSLCMPLAEDTTNIEIKDNAKEAEDNIIACKLNREHSYYLLVIVGILIILDINLIYKLIHYIHKNRTAESIYEKELRKILNNYGSYIQKVNNSFNVKDYCVLEVDTFNDMLEIRETIQEPIIMLENEEKTETYFMIMGKMDLVYVYYIKVSDIKKKRIKRHEMLEV